MKRVISTPLHHQKYKISPRRASDEVFYPNRCERYNEEMILNTSSQSVSQPFIKRLPLAVLLVFVCLSACISPYHIEVVQGNFVSKEQMQALRVGMSRNQVREILGTPLITSPFHADRWDYAFTIKREGTQPQHRRISIFFKVDQFDHAEGDDLPSESEFAAKIDTQKINTSKLPRLEATEKELNAYKVKPKVEQASQVDNAPTSMNYPPLEPVAH
jgi:outer membrane protein assembly factor BamE